MSMAISNLIQARQAKEQVKEHFGRLANLAGIGITRRGDRYAVQVSLAEPLGTATALPDEIAGVPVVVRIVSVAHQQ